MYLVLRIEEGVCGSEFIDFSTEFCYLSGLFDFKNCETLVSLSSIKDVQAYSSLTKLVEKVKIICVGNKPSPSCNRNNTVSVRSVACLYCLRGAVQMNWEMTVGFFGVRVIVVHHSPKIPSLPDCVWILKSIKQW